MDSYKIEDKGKNLIGLGAESGLKPPSSGATGYQEEEKAKLSQIIKASTMLGGLIFQLMIVFSLISKE
ncbi:MAG: hypothetical protein KKF16_10770 [Euryarchaeota archaeon]|nr:hypothetical protein [Euryarchaeota archaeon]MBU4607406.1 hypothetical protein [Euryarchaeota archaeon]MBV1729183.1 hypothetical protein [Methanobacterium sp.]MBV1755879.1 hypothetical protein [Methanobacterium sp.]MBV1768308.1 hypothetical protein [Methanobacterium sp.]